MAERRMFAKAIIDSDIFLDMPLSTQALYFHLAMRADDEGFVNNPKKIQKMIGASDDDIRILIGKRYILTFETGIIVIKHWKIHNYIQSDRFKPTSYIEEKSQLTLDEKKSYVEVPQIGNVSKMDTQVSIGKDRLDKISLDNSKGDANEVDTTPAEIVLTIILNDKTEYEVTKDYFEEMQNLFPGVDVLSEFRKMKAWAINNPTKRKTRRGINKFIGTWLSSAQDNATKRSSETKRTITPATQSEKVYRR